MAPKARPKSIGKSKAAAVRPGGSGVKVQRRAAGDGRETAESASCSKSGGNESVLLESDLSAATDTCTTEPAEPDSVAWQEADLAIRTVPLSRQTFRARFTLLEGSSKLEKPPLWYVLLVPKLRTHEFQGHPGYSEHRIQVSGKSLRGTPIETFDFEHLVLANVPASALTNLCVEHSFVSHRVHLGPRTGTERLPAPTLTAGERLTALADDVDRADKMRTLLGDRGLQRHPGERDLAYAARLGEALRSSEYVYDAAATEDALHLLPTLVFELGRGDCSAFNAGFVYALRSQGVPAHIGLGLKYGRQVEEACGVFAASHAQSELFSEGIGWVQCDATGGVASFEHNGSDSAHFVAWHAATPSFSEAREAADVLRSASADLESALTRIRKVCTRRGLVPDATAPVNDFTAVLTTALSLSSDAAERKSREVAAFCGQPSGISPDEFCDGFAALQLGRCPVHLGAGKGLCATAMAGAALLAGGPYERGVPLDLDELEETAVMVAGHEQVMAALGTGSSGEAGPRGGCFRVEYEFSEEPVE